MTVSALQPTVKLRATPPSQGWLLVPFGVVAVIGVSAVLGVSPFMPLILGAVYPFAERAAGIRGAGLEWRLVLLCGFLILGALVQSHAEGGYLFDDERLYDTLARAWAVGDQPLVDSQWSPFIALIYRAFGVHFIYARWLNAFAGALLIGLLADIAYEWEKDRARSIYWLAGLSPALLLWTVCGLRDLFAGLGVALVVAAWLSPRFRWRRLAWGLAFVVTMIPVLVYFTLGLAVALFLYSLYTRETAWTLPPVVAAVGFLATEFSRYIIDSVKARYFSPESLPQLAKGVDTGQVTDRLAPGAGFLIPAIVLAVLSPTWFVVVAQEMPKVYGWTVAVGGFGWWTLLPLILLGAGKAWSEKRGRVVIIWGIAGCVLAFIGLLTVVRDPARLRLMALGGFFLLAWRGLESPRALSWTKRWLIVQGVLAAVYWFARLGFPGVAEFVHRIGA